MNHHLKSTKIFFCLLSFTFFTSFHSYGTFNEFVDKVKTQINKPEQFINNHPELSLIRCVTHLPGIFLVDSDNPTHIQTCAILSLLATDMKLLHELIYNRGSLLQHLVIDIPIKVGGYSAATCYDIMRYKDAENIALKNQTSNDSKMKSFKLNQSICLIIEVALRLLNYASFKNETPDNLSSTSFLGKRLSWYISGLADVVEIYRLLSRYGTFLSIPKIETNFNVGIKKDSSPKAYSESDNNFSVDVNIKATSPIETEEKDTAEAVEAIA